MALKQSKEKFIDGCSWYKKMPEEEHLRISVAEKEVDRFHDCRRRKTQPRDHYTVSVHPKSCAQRAFNDMLFWIK